MQCRKELPRVRVGWADRETPRGRRGAQTTTLKRAKCTPAVRQSWDSPESKRGQQRLADEVRAGWFWGRRGSRWVLAEWLYLLYLQVMTIHLWHGMSCNMGSQASRVEGHWQKTVGGNQPIAPSPQSLLCGELPLHM